MAFLFRTLLLILLLAVPPAARAADPAGVMTRAGAQPGPTLLISANAAQGSRPADQALLQWSTLTPPVGRLVLHFPAATDPSGYLMLSRRDATAAVAPLAAVVAAVEPRWVVTLTEAEGPMTGDDPPRLAITTRAGHAGAEEAVRLAGGLVRARFAADQLTVKITPGNATAADIAIEYHPGGQPDSLTIRALRHLLAQVALTAGVLDEFAVPTFETPFATAGMMAVLRDRLPANDVATSRPLAVAIYDDAGTGRSGVDAISRRLAHARGDMAVVVAGAQDIRDGILRGADVVMIPGGSGRAIADALAEPGREAITRHIAGGGGYVGICAGAYLPTTRIDNYLGIVRGWHLQPWRRGGGMSRIAFTDEGRAILGARAPEIDTRYNNGPILSLDAEELAPWAHLPGVTVLATFSQGVVDKDGNENTTMRDHPAIVASPYGAGRLLLISPHPESHDAHSWLILNATRWSAGGGPALPTEGGNEPVGM